jgi:glutamate dehydrogenase (NAD(P)+)
MSQTAGMLVEKLTTVDAFVVFDLERADAAVGVTRLAPRVLVDGATWLARSQTYQFASFGQKIGGASAGINARPDGRDEAVAAFVAEVEPWVAAGRFSTEAAKGLDAVDLEPLRKLDGRAAAYFESKDTLVATGLCASAELALGGLDGRRAAIEGFERAGPALAAALGECGASVVAVSTASGTVADASGLDPAALADTGGAGGAGPSSLGREVMPAQAVLGVDADVVFVGSRAGVVDHDLAREVRASVVVPSGPVPVTAKALAVLTRAGVVVLPDFVTTAGALPAASAGAPESIDELQPLAADQVVGVLGEVLDHERGPFLGACLRAEAFLSSWYEEAPFGRPLA